MNRFIIISIITLISFTCSAQLTANDLIVGVTLAEEVRFDSIIGKADFVGFTSILCTVGPGYSGESVSVSIARYKMTVKGKGKLETVDIKVSGTLPRKAQELASQVNSGDTVVFSDIVVKQLEGGDTIFNVDEYSVKIK